MGIFSGIGTAVGSYFGGPVGGAVGGAIGGAIDGDEERSNANQGFDKNAEMQREFAQNGIRWKVADARAAGLHPLAALGAPTTSFSPMQVGSSGPSHDMGQDISRAISATATARERATLNTLQEEHLGLQNDLLRSQIAKLNSAQVGPPLPESVAPNMAPLINVQPAKYQATTPQAPHLQAGTTADIAYARTAGGGLAIIPSRDVKEQVEDITVPQMMWGVRNNLAPNFNSNRFKPDPHRYPPGPGYNDWKWDYVRQEFVPYKATNRAEGVIRR